MQTIKFNHIVLLKKKPYYVMAISENDAKQICLKYGPDSVLTIITGDNLSPKEIQTSISFQEPDIKMIEEREDQEENFLNDEESMEILNEVMNEDIKKIE